MAITTLVELWQQERDIYSGERTAAQTELNAAQLALALATKDLAADAKTLQQLGSAIAAARATLSTTTIPAEANALVAKIRDLIIQQRGALGTLLDHQDARDEAQALLDTAGAALARSDGRLADAEAKLIAATAEHAQRQALATTLAAAPYDTLKNDANTLLGGSTVTNAMAQIDANFPADLRTLVKTRRDTRAGRPADLRAGADLAENALGSAQGTDGGLEGTVAQQAIAFRRAERRVREYVATAKNRFDRAAATLQQLEAIALDTTGTRADVLTAAEKAQVAATPARTAAATAAAAVDTPRDVLHAAQDALDAQILAQINADVDTLNTDPTVQAKRADVTAKANALKTAVDTFAASADRTVLDQWEAVVPDSAWKILLDFEQALAALTDLKGITPTGAGSLVEAMESAEAAYAAARAAAAKAQRRADHYGDALTLRQKRFDAAGAALPTRLLSAVRGDSF